MDLSITRLLSLGLGQGRHAVVADILEKMRCRPYVIPVLKIIESLQIQIFLFFYFPL